MKTVSTRSFGVWLRAQRYRDDPVGDIARDVIEDAKFSRRSGMARQVDYLEWHGACDGAIKALKAAWAEYVRIGGS